MKQVSLSTNISDNERSSPLKKRKPLFATEQIDSIEISQESAKEKEHDKSYTGIMEWFENRKIFLGNPQRIVEDYEHKQHNAFKSNKFSQSMSLQNSKLLGKRKKNQAQFRSLALTEISK